MMRTISPTVSLSFTTVLLLAGQAQAMPREQQLADQFSAEVENANLKVQMAALQVPPPVKLVMCRLFVSIPISSSLSHFCPQAELSSCRALSHAALRPREEERTNDDVRSSPSRSLVAATPRGPASSASSRRLRPMRPMRVRRPVSSATRMFRTKAALPACAASECFCTNSGANTSQPDGCFDAAACAESGRACRAKPTTAPGAGVAGAPACTALEQSGLASLGLTEKARLTDSASVTSLFTVEFPKPALTAAAGLRCPLDDRRCGSRGSFSTTTPDFHCQSHSQPTLNRPIH